MSKKENTNLDEYKTKELSDEELDNVTGGCGSNEVPNDYILGNAPKFHVGESVEMGDWNLNTLKEGYVRSIDPTPTKYNSKDRCKTYIYRCDLVDDDGWGYNNIKVPEYKLRKR